MIDRCYVGDVRDGLRAFIAAGIRAQTCVTSPPYWRLRDYGVEGQIGLEPTPQEYVERMVEVFRLVRDVLADDGTLWLNLGDSYAGNRGNTAEKPGFDNKAAGPGADLAIGISKLAPGYKAKDLIGIPWMVAFALRADGWYLRSDIIWHKPNPMPESVTDRPTKAHEYLFLLTKSQTYYYDAEAIKEPSIYAGTVVKASDPATAKNAIDVYPDGGEHSTKSGFTRHDTVVGEGRNKRTVWTIATRPYPGAHFATYPEDLVEPCILAGSRVGDVVLDPFMGSGTTAQVAQSLGRRWIGTELNRDYVAMQAKRTAQAGLALGVA